MVNWIRRMRHIFVTSMAFCMWLSWNWKAKQWLKHFRIAWKLYASDWFCFLERNSYSIVSDSVQNGFMDRHHYSWHDAHLYKNEHLNKTSGQSNGWEEVIRWNTYFNLLLILFVSCQRLACVPIETNDFYLINYKPATTSYRIIL